jgi:predicted TIM-barrel fold metal-dependent hydrolase
LYQAEYENILKQYPRLKVVCPHFCLSTIRRDRFQGLMDRYPNLYTDTSFGFVDFFKEALMRFSANPKVYRDLIVRYQDRILFGLDLIVSRERYKNGEWLGQMMGAYRDMLEKELFSFSELPGITLRGLNLDRVVLRKIYASNFERFMRKRAA